MAPTFHFGNLDERHCGKMKIKISDREKWGKDENSAKLGSLEYLGPKQGSGNSIDSEDGMDFATY